MSNALVATNTKENAMSKEGALQLCAKIQEGMKAIGEGYLAITPEVAKLDKCKGYLSLGYANMDKCVENEFGMSHGTLSGIRKVWKRFGVVTVNNEYKLLEGDKEWGYTKLLLFATDKDKFEQAGIDPKEVFTKDMTIKQMKSVLQETLSLKAEAQDATAIDTTATEAEAQPTEAKAQPTEAQPTATEAQPTEELTAKAIIDNMLEEVKRLSDMAKTKNVKAEKVALIEDIALTLKEVKKFMK